MENYIKHTAIPYTKLIERAKKGKLAVEYGKTYIDIIDEYKRNIRLFPYEMEKIDEGMVCVEYNYPKN